MTPDEIVAAAGRAAADEAKRLWAQDVIDPRRDDDSEQAARSRELIAQMVRDGLGWPDVGAYQGDGDFSWCGAFVAFCWRQSMLPAVRKHCLASTRRLDKWAGDAASDSCPRRRLVLQPPPAAAIVADFGPRAGDIVLVGAPDSPHGSHIGILVEHEAPVRFTTIEGNGFGEGPGSRRLREGVVRVVRELREPSKLLRLCRPGLADLIPR